MFHKFLDFPEEVLLNISNRFLAKNLLRFSETCTLFNRVSNDMQLWKNLVDRDFGTREMHKNDTRNWKELYKFLYINAVHYADLLRTAFKSPYDENYVSFGSPGYTFLVHAKREILNIEEKLGDINTLYIYQYLIRKTKFVSTISHLQLGSDTEILESLTSENVDDLPKATLYTPIHIFAFLNKSEILILIHEVNPTLMDVFGYEYRTPLHIAAEEGCLEAVETLIRLGACHLAGLNEGHCFTPFMSAIQFGQCDLYPLLSVDHPPIERAFILEFPDYPGFEIGAAEDDDMNYKELYGAEKIYCAQKGWMGYNHEDPSQFDTFEADLYEEYSNNHTLEDRELKVKRSITWLVMNSCIAGKELINLKSVEDAFGIKENFCKIHHQWLSKKRKRQEDDEPSQALDSDSEKIQPDFKRRKFG